MKAELKAVMQGVTFTAKGAKIVLEASTTQAIIAARSITEMAGGEVMATFDDGLMQLPFEEDEPDPTTLPLDSGYPSAEDEATPPTTIIDVPDDGEEDIEEVD